MSDITYCRKKTEKARNICILKTKTGELKTNIMLLKGFKEHIKTKLNTSGTLSPDYSARKIINISAKNKKKNNGKFIDINEKILDW